MVNKGGSAENASAPLYHPADIISCGKAYVMENLLKIIAEGLVEDPSAVSVETDEADEDGVIVYHLHVAPDDMGRVIGKQGKIAKAVRTVMRAAAGKMNRKIMVEID